MKKFFLLLLIASSFVTTRSFGQGMWTWMNGPDALNQPAAYGVQGVASPANRPPAMSHAFCWTVGNDFWMYGGWNYNTDQYYSDLWVFDPDNLTWTWVDGPGTINQQPVFGTIGVEGAANTPGSRANGSTWVDEEGNLWLYGGRGLNNFYADMWKFNVSTQEWTWMSGSNQSAVLPVFGTMGTASASNTPGSRFRTGNAWKDSNGMFWLYGGNNFVTDNTAYADMWMYNPATNIWTWQSGSQTPNIDAVYGPSGVYTSTATPGGRLPSATWVSSDNQLYLFGGGLNTQPLHNYADMWSYNPLLNQWAWRSGSQVLDAFEVAGNPCQSDSAFHPTARTDNRAVWEDSLGNMWMYGGSFNGDFSLADMWVYRPVINQWAKVSSGNWMNTTPAYGVQGIPDTGNTPGAGFGVAHWQDTYGNFWLFGGYAGAATDLSNTMWRYTPDLSCLSANSPMASFLPDENKLCCNAACASFTNQSTDASAWQWLFPGGTPSSSTDQNPSNICYADAGSYDVTLIAINGTQQDTFMLQDAITVSCPAAPLISFQNDTLFASDALMYQWYFESSVISGATNPFYKPSSNGTYTVVVTDDLGCTNSADIDVTTLSTHLTDNTTLQTFPNPADQFLTIIDFAETPDAKLTIYNALGLIIYDDELMQRLTIDVSGLSDGAYLLLLRSRDEVLMHRLIITHGN